MIQRAQGCRVYHKHIFFGHCTIKDTSIPRYIALIHWFLCHLPTI